MGRPQRSEATSRASAEDLRWSLFTTHAEVLLHIARHPDARLREIAGTVGISERGAHQIVADLVRAGYVRRARVGRRNRYAVEAKRALRHSPVRHRRVSSIVALLEPEPRKQALATKQAPRVRLPAASGAGGKTAKRRLTA